MNIQDLVKTIDAPTYENLKQALQLGKWPDGRKLTAVQQEATMQAIILYEAQHNIPEDQRVGYVTPKGSACGR